MLSKKKSESNLLQHKFPLTNSCPINDISHNNQNLETSHGYWKGTGCISAPVANNFYEHQVCPTINWIIQLNVALVMRAWRLLKLSVLRKQVSGRSYHWGGIAHATQLEGGLQESKHFHFKVFVQGAHAQEPSLTAPRTCHSYSRHANKTCPYLPSCDHIHIHYLPKQERTLLASPLGLLAILSCISVQQKQPLWHLFIVFLHEFALPSCSKGNGGELPPLWGVSCLFSCSEALQPTHKTRGVQKRTLAGNKLLRTERGIKRCALIQSTKHPWCDCQWIVPVLMICWSMKVSRHSLFPFSVGGVYPIQKPITVSKSPTALKYEKLIG